MAEPIRSPAGILSYPHLFKARAVNDQSEPRYSCNLIFDEAAQKTPEFRALRIAANEAAKVRFGERMKDERFVARMRKPFRSCSERPGVAGYADVPNGIFISAWSREPIKVFGPGGAGDLITVPSDVFAGQRARIDVNAFGFENAGNVGVSFGLAQVQITRRNMPRLDGRVTKPFEPSAEEDEDDAFGSPASRNRPADDDIPFFESLRVA